MDQRDVTPEAASPYLVRSSTCQAITLSVQLEHYLAQRAPTQQEVTLTFSEINALLDSPLPASAYALRQWWENPKDATTRPQARAWLNAGFVANAVRQERRSGMVRFMRA